MKKDQELIVITKNDDLILWSCNHTSRFPRNHRFVLGARIERNLYGLLETLIAAKYTKKLSQKRPRIVSRVGQSSRNRASVDDQRGFLKQFLRTANDCSKMPTWPWRSCDFRCGLRRTCNA